MAAPTSAGIRRVRFGVFELDLTAGELRKHGTKIRIEGQPLQVLAMLAERSGELVTREEIQQKLWPADTFVDFEGANIVIVNRETGLTTRVTSSGGGTYVSPSLAPGPYELRISALGFRDVVLHVTVEVGRTCTADVRLQVGAAAETMTVTADEVRVNPVQSGLEGVISASLSVACR